MFERVQGLPGSLQKSPDVTRGVGAACYRQNASQDSLKEERPPYALDAR